MDKTPSKRIPSLLRRHAPIYIHERLRGIKDLRYWLPNNQALMLLFARRYETCGGWVSTQQRVVSGKWVSTCLPISGHIIYMILSSNTAAPGPVQWLLSPWTLPGTLQFPTARVIFFHHPGLAWPVSITAKLPHLALLASHETRDGPLTKQNNSPG